MKNRINPSFRVGDLDDNESCNPALRGFAPEEKDPKRTELIQNLRGTADFEERELTDQNRTDQL